MQFEKFWALAVKPLLRNIYVIGKLSNRSLQESYPKNLALVTGLWERLNLQANERIDEIENTNKQQLQELKQTLLHSQQELSRIKLQLHEFEETCAIERNAKNE